MTVRLGDGLFQRLPDLPPEPSPQETLLEQVLEAMAALRSAVMTLPAPQVTVAPQDLSDVVNAVQSLNGPAGPSAAEIALAIKDVLAPHLPAPQSLPMTELVQALEKLDFRLQGVGKSSVGGTVATISNDVSVKPAAGTSPFPVSGPLTDTQLRASLVSVKDDYTSAETLADQNGAGAVLTFTFSSAVDFVWVTDTGSTTTNISRVDAFGATPTATKGAVVVNGAPTPIPVVPAATTVKVYAPAGAVIGMYGLRR